MGIAHVRPQALQKLPPVTAEMLAVYEAARSWKPSAAALR